jgi:acetylornithine/succinyldiaminopimelate/putrescine aminotransferase
MPFDVKATLESRHGENFALHSEFINPQLVRVLKTLGFDRFYVRGEGSYLYDDRTEKYLDMLSGFGVFALGRNHPAIKDALHQAIDLNLPNMVQIDCALLPGLLAEKLTAKAHPGINRAYFCNSGTEAVEASIKFARRATGRTRILYMDHAYHGLTTGSLALNGGKDFRAGFGPLLPGPTMVPFGDIDTLAKELRAGDVAAVIAEPIQGKGVNVATRSYWKELEALCRQYKALFIADEIQCGMGRTGKFFAHEHYTVRPDIITVSKALSGGFIPVAAMLTTDEIYLSVFSSMEKALVHSTTFGRNQLAMVAGLATLTAFEDLDIVNHVAEMGEYFERSLQPLVDRYEMLHHVRGQGFMIGLVFDKPTSPALKLRWSAIEAVRTALFSQMVVVPLFHRHKILTQVAADNMNVVKLLPPLIAGKEEIDYFIGAFDDVMADAHKGLGLLTEFGATMAKSALRRGAPRPVAAGR